MWLELWLRQVPVHLFTESIHPTVSPHFLGGVGGGKGLWGGGGGWTPLQELKVFQDIEEVRGSR